MSNTNSLLLLAGRILLSAMFILSGYPKLLDPAGTAGMIAGAGLPAATLLAYLAGIFELVAGIFVLIGFQTRISALLLAAFAAFTALVFHSGAINIPDFPEGRSEEHTSELQSLMRISYAVFCLKKKNQTKETH